MASQPEHRHTWKKKFPLVGQGTIAFNMERQSPFDVVIQPQDQIPGSQYVMLTVGKKRVAFLLGTLGTAQIAPKLLTKVEGEVPLVGPVGYEPGERVAYWFSFDRDRLVLKYGKGYVMTQTTVMEYHFLTPETTQAEEDALRQSPLFNPKFHREILLYDMLRPRDLARLYAAIKHSLVKLGDLESNEEGKLAEIFKAAKAKLTDKHHGTVTEQQGLIDVERAVKFSPHPLVVNSSPFVLDSSEVTLFELDSNDHIFSASLPPACQVLYGNVTAPNVALDWPPGVTKYKLSDAIRYSIVTPGAILNKKLKEKESEFGPKNPHETYLRVTLGPSHGNSPGIPYVLEIWPKDHGSPIHNHSNAYAVIKVLFGGLTIRVYNKNMKNDSPVLQKFNVKAGDVTWISPNWYQSHKLWNYTGDYCATIQCYQFAENNLLEWPYFDYVDKDKDTIEEFLPTSDFTFKKLRHELLAEYTLHMDGINPKPPKA